MSARPNLTPSRLALLYAGFATAWIAGSDALVDRVISTKTPSIFLHTAKGLLFVGVTALLLYWWARRFRSGTLSQEQALIQARERTETARRMYATLSAVNRRIIRPPDAPTLNRAICRALIDPGGFLAAGIFRVDPERAAISLIAHAGPDLVDNAPIPLTEGGDQIVATFAAAVGGGRVAHVEGPFRPQSALGTAIAQIGGQACVAVPFRPHDADQLVLAVVAGEPGAFAPEVVAMLSELTADLEHGIEVIAERERRTAAESALRASEEQYRLVAENSQDVIWILSHDGKLQYISPSIKRLLGYTPAEIMRMDFSQFLTPESLHRVRSELSAGAEERTRTGRMRSRLLEIEQIRADGMRLWTEIHTTDFNDDTGRSIGLLGVTRDVSERRSAAQALASEIARCRALLDVSMDGIHVTDLAGNLLDANEVFLRERGYTRAMIPSLQIESWDAELDHAKVVQRISAITADPIMFETIHRRAQGGTFPVEVRARRVEIAGRTVIYCTTRDITERKALEQRLLRSQRLESVGLIASGIAHDLNNVLTPILLSTGLLSMRYGAPEDRILLDPIEAAARRGSSIVQQILTFARGAEGQRVAIEPKLLLRELSSLIRETFPRNIVHQLQVAADARPVTGDATQLHQVFLNLAVNARDAMPDGGTLTIDVRNVAIDPADLLRLPSAKPGGYVCIAVSDTGSGMTAETLDHLFEPFFTTKPRGRGTGLGLSTVHGLVRSHGGFVEVNSRLGHGSEFRVFLPAATGSSQPGAAAGARSPQHLGRGEFVLVADDEPAILTVAESVLRRHGFNPIIAADGKEAIAQFDRLQGKIAVVITDVMMPNFDGVRFATEVRRRDPTLPIVAMSGLIAPTSQDETRDQLRALGVTTVIDKPYGEAELLAAIELALRSRAVSLAPSPAG